MTITLFTLIFLSVFLSVVAQILLKAGMSSEIVKESLGNGLFESIIAIFTNFNVLGGLFAYITSAGFWLLVLSKMDVSKAYPFVGLGFVLTMLFAFYFLHEPLTLVKVVGTLMVGIGVVLIASS